MFSRTSDDQTILQLGGEQNDNFIPLTKTSFNFIGRSIFFNQLTGDHRNLKDSKVRLHWNAVVSTGKRDEPDRRLIEQQVESQTVTSASRFFSDLKQLSVGGKTSARFPVYQAFDSTAYATMGFNAGYTDRSFNARRFTQQGRGGSALIGDPDVLFGPDALGPVSTIKEVTQPEDSYVASNLLVGGYAQLETPMAPRLQFLGLLRFEAFRQEVTSNSPFSDDDEEPQAPTDTDLNPMPSANFSIEINEKMFVKLGYGMTVIRPAIRELAPFAYLDFLRGWLVQGNPELQPTQVQNAEARYEYYFGDTDLDRRNGIRQVLQRSDRVRDLEPSQRQRELSKRRVGMARRRRGRAAARLWTVSRQARAFLLLGQRRSDGLADHASRRSADSGHALQRRLFNQSPFVTNLSLRFDDPDAGVMVGLIYNAFGPRIVEAGSPQGGDVIAPDVFQQTQHQLDLIATWNVTEHVKLGFKWKNIALARVRYKQGDELTFLQNWGSTVSIGAEYIY